jgi:hypothetical protein
MGASPKNTNTNEFTCRINPTLALPIHVAMGAKYLSKSVKHQFITPHPFSCISTRILPHFEKKAKVDRSATLELPPESALVVSVVRPVQVTQLLVMFTMTAESVCYRRILWLQNP